jgi:ssDNA-binding Zn-finger/Zn-ribbon topoisomerase 1
METVNVRKQEIGTKCPICESEALYKNGKTDNGKQRFLCLLCGRQFSPDARHIEIGNRPDCPTCGNPMHFYKRDSLALRLRCSCYPDCRTYLKIPIAK